MGWGLWDFVDLFHHKVLDMFSLRHTSYLSFPLHRQDCQIPNFTPKKSKIYPNKSKICIFFAFNLEKFSPDRNFYTGSARDKYEV